MMATCEARIADLKGEIEFLRGGVEGVRVLVLRRPSCR